MRALPPIRGLGVSSPALRAAVSFAVAPALDADATRGPFEAEKPQAVALQAFPAPWRGVVREAAAAAGIPALAAPDADAWTALRGGAVSDLGGLARALRGRALPERLRERLAVLFGRGSYRAPRAAGELPLFRDLETGAVVPLVVGGEPALAVEEDADGRAALIAALVPRRLVAWSARDAGLYDACGAVRVRADSLLAEYLRADQVRACRITSI